MRVREPVARPLDVVTLELLLSASQAFLAGVLLYLAVGIWDDRGFGFGPVAVVLALLGLAVGGAWLYWLLGGVGWPLAAADTPVALFLGFTLVMGWAGEDLLRVRGAPLLLAELAAVYGIVCGVFLDSPRRWRWDQRQKLRPGTKVPRVSPATASLVARVPRSLPARPTRAGSTSELAARIERSSPTEPAPSGDVGVPYVRDTEGDEADLAVDAATSDGRPDRAPRTERPVSSDLAEAPAVEGVPIGSSATTASTAPGQDDIELPTSVEPKAQRSPWAWAAPPTWNRDEDDEAPGGSSRRR